MSEAKIEFKLGSIEFSGEGEQDWVSQQLDKLLKQAPQLLTIAPIPVATMASNVGAAHHAPMVADPVIAQQTLVSFLKSRGSPQVKKFLATAVWLEAKGNARITAADVAKALKESNQTRLANPDDCLAKNIAKGFCEKDGAKFFVTTDGKNSL